MADRVEIARRAEADLEELYLRVVERAPQQGARLVDMAAASANERQVGKGIRRPGISRDDMFIETKVRISDYGYDATLHAFDKSAGKLGVDRIDLLLLHQPMPSRFDLTRCIRTSADRAIASACRAWERRGP